MTKQELLAQWADHFPNFSVEEIDCNCSQCGHELWDEKRYGDTVPDYFIQTMQKLQELRTAYGKTMYISSAHRCVDWNANPAVGGGKSSWHLRLAFDIAMSPKEQEKFAELARSFGFNGIGFYPSRNFIHIDMRKNYTTWNG